MVSTMPSGPDKKEVENYSGAAALTRVDIQRDISEAKPRKKTSQLSLSSRSSVEAGDKPRLLPQTHKMISAQLNYRILLPPTA